MAGKPSSGNAGKRGARFSRRVFIAGTLASACGHKRAARYQGWLFAASGVEKEIAVADLASFRRVASIPLPCAADQLFRSPSAVFALCGDARAILEIDPERQRVAGKIALPGKPVAARLISNGAAAVVLTTEPGFLLTVDLVNRRLATRLQLPDGPRDLDVSGSLAVITIPDSHAILRVRLGASSSPQLKSAGLTDVGVPCLPVRFRRDGQTILAGAPSVREIVTLDSATGKLLARLPLPVSPSRFCFHPDGGQMFVTGDGAGTGEDALAIVRPFQNDVAETVLAGRTPCAMAVSESRNLLFVTNPGSGDLTIMDIDTRGVSASVHVGETPGDVLLTPDGEYALVLDQRSGNVSVVRIPTVLDRKVKTKPLFTVFPTAAGARSAIIVPFA
jgi:YVTN family beta-propeller protein